MKQIRDYHKEFNKFPEYKNFNVAYNYNSFNKCWNFAGYKCVKCGKVLTQRNAVPRHQNNCKEINFKRVYKNTDIDPSAKVMTINRNVWEPFDSNQI